MGVGAETIASLVERASRDSASLSGAGRAIGIVQSDDNQRIVSGLADIGIGRKVAVNTRFRIASLSKPMLSIALSGLENRKRLSLNDPLGKHLPEISHLSPELTLRTLLAHRGGWHEKLELLALAGADHSDPVDKETIQKLLRSQRETNFPPGSGYLYCNSGFTLLSDVLERASDQSFSEAMQSLVFLPLGMYETSVVSMDDEIVPEMARGYTSAMSSHRLARYGFYVRGEGGVVSSLSDMSTLVGAFAENAVPHFDLADIITPLSASGIRYDRGLVIREIGGHAVIGHSGHLPGFKSDFMVAPKVATGLIWMENFDEADTFGSALSVMRSMLQVTPTPCEPVPVDLRGEWIETDEGLILQIATSGLSASLFGEKFGLRTLSPSKWCAESDVIDFEIEATSDGIVAYQGGRRLGKMKRCERQDRYFDGILGFWHAPEIGSVFEIVESMGGVALITHGMVRRRGPELITPLTKDFFLLQAKRDPWEVQFTVRLECNGMGVPVAIKFSSSRMRNLRAEAISSQEVGTILSTAWQ